MSRPRILSGVQPTGNLHLGNYLGAIRNWVRLQDSHECFFMLADLHAITSPQDPASLTAATREVAAAYIASGIDPHKSVIFPQSSVSAHAELAWILSCHTPLGWLNRMTQFKDKSGKNKENAPLGLYAYPVLMAADILTYKATHVPVGEDQKQHLELARDIAGAFNRAAKEDFFPLPEPVILPAAARIMSLNDGTRKMSKSEESDYSRINLTDDDDTIAKKFKKAKSDSHPTITYEPKTRPEAANLLQIYAALSDISIAKATEHFAGKNFGALKSELADMAVEKLSPITKRMRELVADKAALDAILKRGAEAANDTAQPILREVKKRIGFVQV